MSQIKKALEKAKKEKKIFSIEGHEHAKGTEAPPSDQGRLEERLAPDVVEVAPQTYSQTRCVRVNHKKLIDRKVFSVLQRDKVGDQYKLLRTMILNRTRPLGYNAIQITSFKEKEGKSLTCVNLAITLAKEPRQKVLLVDMDLRRPTIHSILDIDPKPGLRDYFVNGIPLKDILIHPDLDGLTVLPAGEPMDNSTEIMDSHRMENLIREIKNRYRDRYIIFDSPALNMCSDPLVLSSYTDAIVLVARANHTTTEDITSGMALLKDKNILGVVLNDSELGRTGGTY